MKNRFCLLLCIVSFTGFAQIPDSTVYELRIYKTAEGKRDVLTSIIQKPFTKMLEKQGIKPFGFWIDADSNKVIYIVAHKSKMAMDASWKKVYADPQWSAIKEKLTKDGNVVLGIESIPMCGAGIMQTTKSVPSPSPLRFELRTYTCYPDRLPNLITRFKSKTTALFAKHHLEGIAYWTTMQNGGVNPRLVYILAHNDKPSQETNWKEFRADSDWISFKEASEKDGKIVERVDVINMTMISPR